MMRRMQLLRVDGIHDFITRPAMNGRARGRRPVNRAWGVQPA
jgi:hypothetical protein